MPLPDPANFFRPVRCENSRLTLEKDRFYILSTKERISVPLHLSGEMIPFSHRVGEVPHCCPPPSKSMLVVVTAAQVQESAGSRGECSQNSVPVCRCVGATPRLTSIGRVQLRAHYAGFFDPGFGYGLAGEIKGTVGVLEVRPHETITIYDGQPICLMEFFR